MYLFLSNTTNVLNPPLYATCFCCPWPSSGIRVHNLKPKWPYVKGILQFVRSHQFYNCHNIGWWGGFYSLGISLFFFTKTIVSRIIKSFLIFFCRLRFVERVWIFSFCGVFHISVCAYSLWKLLISRWMINYYFWCSLFTGLHMLLKLVHFVWFILTI